jgi:hypothetical protein
VKDKDTMTMVALWHTLPVKAANITIAKLAGWKSVRSRHASEMAKKEMLLRLVMIRDAGNLSSRRLCWLRVF